MKLKALLKFIGRTQRVCVLTMKPIEGSAAQLVDDFQRDLCCRIWDEYAKTRSNPEVLEIRCQGSEIIIHVLDHRFSLTESEKS